MRKIVGVLLALFLFLVGRSVVFAQVETVNVHFFFSNTCPHCAREAKFLEGLGQRYNFIKVYGYEVGSNWQSALLLQQIGKELPADVSGVPFTVIGKEHFAGYYNDQTTGSRIEAAVLQAKEQGYNDLVGELIGLTPSPPPSITPSVTPAEPTPTPYENEPEIGGEVEELSSESPLPEVFDLPILGEVKTKDLSLPALTFVIALLDGFNPCAMWVLLFLISLLIGMKDSTRRWLLGMAFIFASALVYFLFLAAWLNLVLFLGFLVWARILIGLVAIAVGVKNLRDWYLHLTGCVVGSDEKRQKIFKRIREIIATRQIIVSLVGIVLLAFAVNLVELLCSFGLPAAYTQTLVLTNLPTWQYYAYLLFYILIFMIDDIFVFIVAMVTLQGVGIESKYARLVSLLGGAIMLFIGFALIFKPELLIFG
jgi:thiol-disulfide isomerase/thioredoxin